MKNFIIIIITILLASIFVGCGGGSSSSDSYGSVSLTITENNKPIKNVNVSLIGPESYNETTDEDGNVVFAKVKTGSYNITIQGYEYTKTIYINENEVYKDTINVKDKPEGTYTFMLYANSYNLDSGLIKTLKQCFEYGSTEKITVVVLFKLSDNETYRGKIVKNSSGDIYYGLEKIQTCDFGNVNTLNSFITWTQKNYPSDNYILCLWNHGSGWDPNFDTKAINHEKNSYIQIYELRDATENKGIDTILFDACSMAFIEVATSMKFSFKYMLGSEKSVPIESYNYENLLRKINENELIVGLKKFAAEQVENSYWKRTETDIQLIDLTKIDNVNSNIKDIAEYLTDNMSKYRTEINNARTNTPNLYNNGKDITVFFDNLTNIIQDSELEILINKYKISLKDALIYSYNYEDTSGLEVNLPSRNEYKTTYENYKKTDFNQETNWDSFLASL